MHDVNHTAKTNLFEINSHSKLATRYNDSSPLENNHIATVFKIIKSKECDIFENLDLDSYNQIRK